MSGILYGIGVGPGDPELLTLKAARALSEVAVVVVPVTQVGGESYALSIVSGRLSSKQRILKLLFPMVNDVATRQGHRQAAARAVEAELLAGQKVAFLTEGDPCLYSTFIYLLHHLSPEWPVKIIPGVSSVMAAAAQARWPLVNADQRLAVIPATSESLTSLPQLFRDFDTVVLLKFNRVFEPLLDLLDELHLSRQTVVVERASHPAGRVIRDIHALRGMTIHYLSLMIVHSGRIAEE